MCAAYLVYRTSTKRFVDGRDPTEIKEEKFNKSKREKEYTEINSQNESDDFLLIFGERMRLSFLVRYIWNVLTSKLSCIAHPND